jgi:hypothetical protein
MDNSHFSSHWASRFWGRESYVSSFPSSVWNVSLEGRLGYKGSWRLEIKLTAARGISSSKAAEGSSRSRQGPITRPWACQASQVPGSTQEWQLSQQGSQFWSGEASLQNHPAKGCSSLPKPAYLKMLPSTYSETPTQPVPPPGSPH